MKTSLCGDAGGDLCVAVKTSERWFAGCNLVTDCAVGRSFQSAMGLRERAWRDLGGSRRREVQHTKGNPEQTETRQTKCAHGCQELPLQLEYRLAIVRVNTTSRGPEGLSLRHHK